MVGKRAAGPKKVATIVPDAYLVMHYCPACQAADLRVLPDPTTGWALTCTCGHKYYYPDRYRLEAERWPRKGPRRPDPDQSD